MKTYKRMLLVRDAGITDAVQLLIETEDGQIPLRIPAELLNSAISGLSAAAHELSMHRPPQALQPNQATIAAPFFAQTVGVHAEGPQESVLTVQCGPAAIAIHMTPAALREAASRMEQAAQTVRDLNPRAH